MPTEQKTSLGLNRWQGTDKPARADFVADNETLDSLLAEHFGDTQAHLSAEDGGNLQWKRGREPVDHPPVCANGCAGFPDGRAANRIPYGVLSGELRHCDGRGRYTGGFLVRHYAYGAAGAGNARRGQHGEQPKPGGRRIRISAVPLAADLTSFCQIL